MISLVIMFSVDATSISNSTNLTSLFGPDDNITRWGLVTFMVVIIIISLVGNTVVLIGSLKYKVLASMDQVSIILLENIACTDLIITLISTMVMLTTLVSERWILGAVLCAVSYFRLYVLFIEMFFITAMSSYRLKIISSPFSAPLPQRTAKVIVVMVWVFWIVFGVVRVGFDSETKIVYLPNSLQCWYGDGDYSDMQVKIGKFTSGIALLMIIALSLCNVVMLYYIANSAAFRGNGHTPGFKALKTVTCVCSVFIVSYLPTIVLFGLIAMGRNPANWTYALSAIAVTLSTISNPIIYGLTNPNFAKFLRRIYCKAVNKKGVNIMSSNMLHANGVVQSCSSKV